MDENMYPPPFRRCYLVQFSHSSWFWSFWQFAHLYTFVLCGMLTWFLNKTPPAWSMTSAQVFRWRRRAPVPPPFHPRPRADGPCWPICHRVQRHLWPRTGRLERESREKDDLKISRKITKDTKNSLKCLIKWYKMFDKDPGTVATGGLPRGSLQRSTSHQLRRYREWCQPWEILTPRNASKHHRVVRICSALSLRRCHHHHEGLIYSCISSNHQRKWRGRGMQLVTKETSRWGKGKELTTFDEQAAGIILSNAAPRNQKLASLSTVESA